MDNASVESQIHPLVFILHKLIRTEAGNQNVLTALNEIKDMVDRESPDYLTINIHVSQLL